MAIKVSGTEVISDDKRILNNESLPDIRPSLLLDFANSKTLDPRITFTRGSTATYWDGKTTAKAEENLLKYSQELDNSYWTKLRISVSSNQTAAPDGTTTADQLIESTDTGTHGVIRGPLGVTDATMSIFAKQNTRSGIVIKDQTGNGASFDLSSGTVISTTTNFSSSITSAGNGWYRCTVSGTFANDGLVIALLNGSNQSTYTGDGSSSIYAWGAQVEQRSSATAYTATTDSPIVKYQPTLQTAASGEARFDHDPVTGESKGLLIEEARTNLVTYSEDFTNAAWSKTRSTISSNVSVAPDGTTTADKLVASTDNNNHRADFPYTASATTAYTLSVFAKAGEYTGISLSPDETSNTAAKSAYFDLSAGTVTEGVDLDASSITDVGNGWFLCSATITTGASPANRALIGVMEDGSTISYTGDGYSGIYIWGAQVEEGSFPTSYIPTSGSTVTRAVDVVSGQFSDVQGEGAFTVYADYSIPDSLDRSTSSVLNVVRSTGGSSDGYWRIRDGSYVGLQVTDAQGSLPVNMATTTTTLTTDVKVAATVANNDFAFYVNSDYYNATDTSGIYVPRSSYYIGSNGSSEGLNGTMKKLAFYPKRLPNATLQAMTEA